MNYLNLEVSKLSSPNVIGADPVERATWLMLLAYCSDQENSGRISSCREWKCRRWQQLAAVTLKEVLRSCDLWKWDGDDLLVWGYPVEQEAEVQQRRERARENGQRGGRPKKPTSETQKKPTLVPTSEPTSESVKERKEKEGKEKEVPPNPQGGGERRVLPERWRNIPKQDRKNHRVLHNNRLMQRIGAWFARKPETLWTLAEGIARRRRTTAAAISSRC
jgi:hypothetical protein